MNLEGHVLCYFWESPISFVPSTANDFYLESLICLVWMALAAKTRHL